MFEAIKGVKVLVTGAGSGIGASTAHLFGQYGAVVGVHYHRSKDNAEKVVRRIREEGGEAFLLNANLLNQEERESVIPDFIRHAGGIDVLINNAGTVYGHDHFLDMDMDSWEKTLQICLTVPFFLAREAFRFMKDHEGGRIINISSIASKYGGSEITAHYGAAKGGLDAVTRTLARSGAEYNILVNSIQPGVIDTAFHKKIGRDSLDERVKRIPLHRAGTPLDVARLCLFLASECGDYITGQAYGVTGGD